MAAAAVLAAGLIVWGLRDLLADPPGAPGADTLPGTTPPVAAPGERPGDVEAAPPVAASAPLPPRGEPPPDAPNLLLVTLCSVRADRLGVAGHAAARTPTIDALADAGVRFTHAWASATFTLPSHASMLTGLYPGRAGVLASTDVLPAALDTLPEVLRMYGYTTLAWAPVASRASFRSGDGLEQGFDRFSSSDAGALSALLGDTAGPWFALVHLKEAHRPYGLDFDHVEPVFREWDSLLRQASRGNPDRLLSQALTRPEVRAQLDAAYDASLTRDDTAIAGLLDTVRARGELARTVVVVVGDHGESLGEHGFIGHEARLTPEVLHVPFVVSGAGRGVVRENVGLVDLMPTLIELAKGVSPAGIDGRSLVPLLTGGTLPERPLLAQAERVGEDPTAATAALIAGQSLLTRARVDTLYQRDAADVWGRVEDPALARTLGTTLDGLLAAPAERTSRPATAAERAALQQQGYF